MSIIPDFSCLHGRSLMVSLVLLVAGVGIWIPWIKYGYSPTLIHLVGMLTTGCIHIAFWIVGLVSLIRDSDRGYVGWKVRLQALFTC